MVIRELGDFIGFIGRQVYDMVNPVALRHSGKRYRERRERELVDGLVRKYTRRRRDICDCEV